MPFRMLFANPFALAVITVAAIGVITYQILNNRRRVPTRGRGRYRDDDDDGPNGPDKPDETPGGFSLSTGDDNGHLKDCSEPKSETPSGGSEVRKRTVATGNPEDVPKTKKINCNESQNHPDSFPNCIDGNSELSSDSSRNSKSRYSAQENKEAHKVENNISQVNSNNFVASISEDDSDSSESNNSQVNSKNSFVANIDDDEDSDSSESNDSDSDSSESNNSFPNLNKSIDLNESTHSIASCSTTSSNHIRTPSPIDNSEEIYKRDVCSYLKTDIYEENGKENFSGEESVSFNNFSAASEDSNTSCSSKKKPDLCKGCLEEIANAVAYPCKHCYLCLDCAVKVHRIFKKCTICSSVIKTFEQF